MGYLATGRRESIGLQYESIDTAVGTFVPKAMAGPDEALSIAACLLARQILAPSDRFGMPRCTVGLASAAIKRMKQRREMSVSLERVLILELKAIFWHSASEFGEGIGTAVAETVKALIEHVRKAVSPASTAQIKRVMGLVLKNGHGSDSNVKVWALWENRVDMLLDYVAPQDGALGEVGLESDAVEAALNSG